VNESLLEILLCCDMFWSELKGDILVSEVDQGCSMFSEILNEDTTDSNCA
jgi:hypothetical protein